VKCGRKTLPSEVVLRITISFANIVPRSMPRRVVRPWILFSGIWRVVSANKELGMSWPRSVARFRINAISAGKKRRIGEDRSHIALHRRQKHLLT